MKGLSAAGGSICNRKKKHAAYLCLLIAKGIQTRIRIKDHVLAKLQMSILCLCHLCFQWNKMLLTFFGLGLLSNLVA